MSPSIIPPPSEPGIAPFWSVMIPMYRPDEKYLRQTLESVLQQDPGPEQMQIEVLDDGSPGGAPAELIRRIAGDRVTVHCEPANNGLAGIWNRCIERARGKWVHILHQDDLVLKGFYENFRSDIESFPEIGAAYCRHAYIAGDGHWEGISALDRRSVGILENALFRLFSFQHIQCPSIVVRRSVYEKLGGFNFSFTHALDWEMWIRIAASYPVLFDPRIGACFRNHNESVSAAQYRTGESVRDVARMIRYCGRYLPSKSAGPLVKKTLHTHACLALERAYASIWKRDFEAARVQAACALACESSLRIIARAAFIRIRCFEQELRLGPARPK